MTNSDQQNQQSHHLWYADLSIWLTWLGLLLLAVSILPFVIRNSEIVRQIAAICG